MNVNNEILDFPKFDETELLKLYKDALLQVDNKSRADALASAEEKISTAISEHASQLRAAMDAAEAAINN